MYTIIALVVSFIYGLVIRKFMWVDKGWKTKAVGLAVSYVGGALIGAGCTLLEEYSKKNTEDVDVFEYKVPDECECGRLLFHGATICKECDNVIDQCVRCDVVLSIEEIDDKLCNKCMSDTSGGIY